jgi:type IV secretory pathway VirB2 component (pilin)
MGPTKANNSAKLVAKTITDIGVSVYQGCNEAISQDQNLSVQATNGSTINIGDIDWSQTVSTNIACVQSSTTSTAIDNAIQQAAQQTATATNQEFNISGETATSNISEQIEEVQNAISLAFQQECTGLISQNQNVNFVASNGSVVTVGNLNWSQTADAVSQCIQTTDAVTTATNSLTQSLEQSATSTVESFLGPFIAIIIVIVIVIGLIIYRGVGAFTNWRFLLVVGGAVVLYFIAALIFKWPPFHKSDSSDDSSDSNGSGSNGSSNGGSGNDGGTS